MRTDTDKTGIGVITDALHSQGLAASAPAWLEWYHDALVVYAKAGPDRSPEDDVKVATVETTELADEIVSAHNQLLIHVQSPRFGRSAAV